MHDEQFEDLKQFVAQTVGQAEAHLKQEIADLRTEMRAGFEGVGDAIETYSTQVEALDKRVGDDEVRLTALEAS